MPSDVRALRRHTLAVDGPKLCAEFRPKRGAERGAKLGAERGAEHGADGATFRRAVNLAFIAPDANAECSSHCYTERRSECSPVSVALCLAKHGPFAVTDRGAYPHPVFL